LGGFRVALSREAELDLRGLPFEVAEPLIDRLFNYLSLDVAGRSEQAYAPYPLGRLHRYFRTFEGQQYRIIVLFHMGQGHRGEEQLQVLRILHDVVEL